jgi:hypothetical protein
MIDTLFIYVVHDAKVRQKIYIASDIFDFFAKVEKFSNHPALRACEGACSSISIPNYPISI